MRFVKKTVILSSPEGRNYDSLKLESARGGVELTYVPSSSLSGCLIGIKEQNMPVNISLLVFPVTKLFMSEEYCYNTFVEFIIVNPNNMNVCMYGNTSSTYPNKNTLLDGFRGYSTKAAPIIAEKEEKIAPSQPILEEQKVEKDIKEVVTVINDETVKIEDNIQVKTKKSDNKSSKNLENIIAVEKEPKKVEMPFEQEKNLSRSGKVSEKKTINTEYYDSIKKDIEELLATKPPVLELASKIEGSHWVRIDDGDDYVIGVVFEGKVPLFVCYGTAGTENNPLSNEYNFVEIQNGKGYWIIYQNASNGEIVKQ